MCQTPKKIHNLIEKCYFSLFIFPSGVLPHSFALQYLDFVPCDLQLQTAYLRDICNLAVYLFYN